MDELNIGVLADFTSVLWDYRNILLEITMPCTYTINVTLLKDAETCRRVMTFLKGGYDLLIIDSARYERQEDEFLYFLQKKADSLRILVRRGNAFYLRRIMEHGEEPIQLLAKNGQGKVPELLADALNRIYTEKLQICT